ncbi:MAG: hypothetical protein IPH28_25275 [Cytophagaceae bacterium]|nr:hypothetical protein [Cytophagaceae bacterium]
MTASIHFREDWGSRSALPILAFMDAVYRDKALGYSPGPFPKPTMKIEKDYLSCFSIAAVAVDSTALRELTPAEIDSIQRYRNRLNDSTISLDRIKIRRPGGDSLK